MNGESAQCTRTSGDTSTKEEEEEEGGGQREEEKYWCAAHVTCICFPCDKRCVFFVGWMG